MVTALALCAALSVSLPASAARVDSDDGRPAAASPAGWSQFRNGPAHLGVNPHERILDRANVGELAEAWSVAIGSQRGATVSSSPAVVGGTVYIGSDDENLYALEARTGAVRWRFRTGGRVYSSPAVADGLVFVGSMSRRLHAVHAATGRAAWSYDAGGFVDASPAVAAGVVYVSDSGGLVHAVSARTGARLWTRDLHADGASSPAVVGGTVYVGSEDGRLHALRARSGAPLWSTPIGDQITSAPCRRGWGRVRRDERRPYPRRARRRRQKAVERADGRGGDVLAGCVG
jgi:outer membrane protein assembly factor BamB